MKSTPMRGVKEILKPDAYKQSEGAHRRQKAGNQRARNKYRILVIWFLELFLSYGELTAYLLYNGSAT